MKDVSIAWYFADLLDPCIDRTKKHSAEVVTPSLALRVRPNQPQPAMLLMYDTRVARAGSPVRPSRHAAC